MTHELRCKKLHGIWLPEVRAVEVKCDSRFCGAAPGLVVLHRFFVETGEVETRKYKDPERRKQRHGSNSSVRSA